MSETVTLIEQTKPTIITEGLAQLALKGAVSTAERAGFTLSEEVEAELQRLFDVDPSTLLPLSAHGLGCSSDNAAGMKNHRYLLPGFETATE